MTMPDELPPETTPEWTEQDEVDLRDFARFIGPDFTPSAKAAYRFAREIRRLRSEREAQDAEIAKLRSRELVAEVIVSFIEDTLSGGNDLAFRHTMDHDGQRSQSNDEDGTIVWINAPIGDPDRSGSLDGESFTDAMADYIRRSGTPEVVAELNAGLRSELSRSRSADVAEIRRQRNAWRDYAEHLDHCVECSQMGPIGDCFERKELQEATKCVRCGGSARALPDVECHICAEPRR